MGKWRRRFAVGVLVAMVAVPAQAVAQGSGPPKPVRPSLGPELMIRIATKPLLLMVATYPTQLRFMGKGARLYPGVARSVVAASVPGSLRGLLGARVNLYEAAGKVCSGVVREFVFVNREYEIPLNRGADPPPPPVAVLSPGDFLVDAESPRPPDESPPELPISDQMWRTKPTDGDSAAGLALTVRVKPDPGCAAELLIWGRLALLPSVEVYPSVPVESALVKTVTGEALRLFAATSVHFKECDYCAPFKRWPDFVRKNLAVAVFRGERTGRRIVSAAAGFRQEGACSQVGNFALFESRVNPESLLRLLPVAHKPTSVQAAVDLDGDGWPELILADGWIATYIDGTMLLFSNGGRYNRGQDLTVTEGCSE